MHEMSIALEICRIAAERVGPGRANTVRAIGLDLGDDAGVEPDSLRLWLDVLLADPPFDGAKAEISLQRGDTLRVSYLTVDDGAP